jgi:predicted peptidase
MRFFLISLLLGGLAIISSTFEASAGEVGLLNRTVLVGENSYTYQLYVPSNVQGQEKPPVILFLHGIGQRGAGGFLPSNGAASDLARQYLEKVPAIILLPQCEKGQYWHSSEMEQMVMAELNQSVSEFHADSKRLYLTGVSMGGFGVWFLASQHPGTFAAMIPICGGSPLVSGDRFAPIAQRVGRTPVWDFHGADDPIVPVSESRQMVAALRAVKGNRVIYSEFKGVGHNVWMKALNEPKLLPWLFEQHLD